MEKKRFLIVIPIETDDPYGVHKAVEAMHLEEVPYIAPPMKLATDKAAEAIDKVFKDAEYK